MNVARDEKPDCLDCPYEYTCDWDKNNCWYINGNITDKESK